MTDLMKGEGTREDYIALVAQHYFVYEALEAAGEAFAGDPVAAPFLSDGQGVTIANPLSEKFTTLRPALIPGLLDATSHNRRHGRRDVRLFEIGTRFSRGGEVRAAAAYALGEMRARSALARLQQLAAADDAVVPYVGPVRLIARRAIRRIRTGADSPT